MNTLELTTYHGRNILIIVVHFLNSIRIELSDIWEKDKMSKNKDMTATINIFYS